MAISPDAFLLIVVSSGILIIIIGMIIAVNCPLKALSCSFCFKHMCRFFRRGCRKKKAENWQQNIIKYTDGKRYGPSLVEGRPQGHGFYTSGPWSSTETTSTCLGGADALKNVSLLAAQTEIMGTQYFAMMSATSGGGGGVTNNANSSTSHVNHLPPSALVYTTNTDPTNELLSDMYVTENLGDNSNPLNLSQVQIVCMNCHGSGYLHPPVPFQHFINQNNENDNQGNAHHHLDAGSSGCLSSSDSAMALDMDADMIMCM